MLLSKLTNHDEIIANCKTQYERLSTEVDDLKKQANTRPDLRCKYSNVYKYNHKYV